MDFIKIYNFLEKHYYKKSGLLIGCIFVFSLLKSLNVFLKQTISDGYSLYRFLLLGLLMGLWPVIWFLSRNYLPKTSKGKIGIIVSIDAENEKQKIRIKVDFAGRLKNMLRQHNLSSVFDVIVLNDYQSSRAIEILNNYLKRQLPNDVVKWMKFTKEIRGHFFVWGNIIERQDEENKYFINLDGLVVHRPIDLNTKKELHKEFLASFQKEISFYEKFEMKGFNLAADTVYLAARYMTGIAAFISGDPETAIKLHDRLKEEIDSFPKPLPSNLAHISKKLDPMVLYEKCILATHYYFNRNEVVKARDLVQECLSKSNDLYEGFILFSYIKFKEDRNPVESLKILHKAKKVSRRDYTWLYNKAFLLMYMGKFKQAVKDYKKLSKLTFFDEDSIVNKCIQFNEVLLKVEPDKVQYLFVIGLLFYKKKANLPMALDYFEKFNIQANGKQDYRYLLEVSSSYISEIKLELELSSHEDTD